MTEQQSPSCIHCGKDDNQAPLVVFFYKDRKEYICTEHFPILIHRPTELDDKLPDMDKLNPIAHD